MIRERKSNLFALMASALIATDDPHTAADIVVDSMKQSKCKVCGDPSPGEDQLCDECHEAAMRPSIFITE